MKGGKSLRKWGKNVGDFLKNVGDFPKNVGDFPKNVGDFPKNVGDFLKNVGDFLANVRVLGRDGGENSPQVGQQWENRWKGVPPLVQLLLTSGATFAPIWCSFHTHLVQPSPPSGVIFTRRRGV